MPAQSELLNYGLPRTVLNVLQFIKPQRKFLTMPCVPFGAEPPAWLTRNSTVVGAPWTMET
eukprot:1156724-Pelagomonas_calceolata.AAC.15